MSCGIGEVKERMENERSACDVGEAKEALENVL